MVDASFPITGIDEPGKAHEGSVMRLDINGLEVRQESIPAGRFSWLEFLLPSSGYRVKALGEVVGVVGGNGPNTVTYRFKHIFPRDRMAMDEFLNEAAAA